MRSFKDFLIITEAKTAKDKYILLKNEINDLWNKFEELHSMPSIGNMKEEIWKKGEGNACINDLGWLQALSRDIADVTNQRPPFDSTFISNFDSLDERYEKIKKYSSKLIPFIDKYIKKYDSALKEYGYDHAWMDFDECKENMNYSLKELKKLETVEDDYKKKDSEMSQVWKKLMWKCEELYKFANYVLLSYDIKELNWRTQDWIYNGKKTVENFLDYTFNLLDKNQGRFEKNMTDNEYYLKTGDYSGNIGKY